MNLCLQVMAFIMLGIVTINSQSDDHLMIPEGVCEGCTVSKQKLRNEIANRFTNISRVYDIYFVPEMHFGEIVKFIILFGVFMDELDLFTVSFTAETTSGHVYKDIQCVVSLLNHNVLRMTHCESDKSKLSGEIIIDFDNIVIIDKRDKDSLNCIEEILNQEELHAVFGQYISEKTVYRSTQALSEIESGNFI